MEIIGRAFSALLSMIFPADTRASVLKRAEQTQKAFTSNIELKIFWLILRVLLFPITLAISMVVALLKTIFIWILPSGLYVDLRFSFNTFFADITKRHLPIQLALRRAKLHLDLFTKGREKQVSFGDKNPDKTFFVIRPYYYLEPNEVATTVANLLYHYYRNLQHLSYAVKNGWIPVIDWENYGPFPHGEDHPIHGTMNCWEYFWNQPSEYTLEEVYQSKNVILSSRNSVDYGLIPSTRIAPPLSDYAKRIARLCPVYDGLITRNQETERYIQEKQDGLFPKDARILGISVRGASYGAKQVPGHPVQPAVHKLLQAAEEVVEEWGADYIFFACEMSTIVDEMRNQFGDRLLVLPRHRYDVLPTKEDDPLYVPGERYQTNLDYLTEMVLLSRCDSLLAGMSGGVRAAIVWNANAYSHIKIFENGMW